MQCTGDQELHVIRMCYKEPRVRAIACALEVNRGEKFAHVQSSIGMRLHGSQKCVRQMY